MNKLINHFFVIFLSLPLMLPVIVQAEEEIRIALRANKGAIKGLKKWQATSDYLTKNIDGYRFVLTPFENNSALNEAVSLGEFDYCLTNPASAVEHKIRYGAQPLATLVNKRQGKGYSEFGSVIFTRSDRADVNNFDDLKNKSFLGVDELGFGGWRVAWRELLQNNINPYTDFKYLRFAGGKQQKVVYSVKDGKVDAGSVRTDMLERMAAAGKIKLSDFKVLGARKTVDFPFLHSTQLYPEWLFSAVGNRNEKLTSKIVIALLSIPEGSLAANKGKYIGWISPKDYSPVDELLKDLKVGPYHIRSMTGFDDFIEQYGYIFFVASIVALLLILTVLYMLNLNRKITHTQSSLKKEIVTRERAEYVLASLAQQSLDFTKEETFFNECLINLSELFSTKYAFIGLFSDAKRTKIKTHCVWSGERFEENFEYELTGTPCQDVLSLKEELIEKEVAKRYPDDEMLVSMDIESYFGVPLISPSGKMIGLVSVMDTAPLVIDKTFRPILKIFANRIALEMQRKWEEEELKGMAKELSFQASHDSLTGLVNRREFENRLMSVCATLKNSNEHHALCYLDLDQFKIVNDTCGHLAGDELLKLLADRLDSVVRASDTLARLGGDEFGILLLDCPLEKAKTLSEKFLDTIKEFRFSWEDNVFEIGASIGLVPINPGDRDIYELLQAADTACYVAKDQGRNRIHVYNEDDIAVASHQGQMRWVTEITRAIDEDDFLLYRQVIVAANSTKDDNEHYEILIRMRNAHGEVLLPGSFISAAERYSLMESIDQWVIKNSFDFISKSHSKDKLNSGNVLYAINLSGVTISNERFPDFIEAMIKQYDMSPNAVCFEITETAAISSFSQAIKFIEIMKRKGFSFALDDFGTGLCSYAYLKSLPVDYLKIDGRFVSGLEDDPMNKVIIESIVKIAKVMKVHTIAEWVDSEYIEDQIKLMGVDYLQGYHIGMPAPVDAE